MKSNHQVRIVIVFCLFLSMPYLSGADYAINQIDPPLWWVGMHNSNLQLMVHGNNISDLVPKINYPGITVETVVRTINPNYLFINLNIDKQAQAGIVKIDFYKYGKHILSYNYKLMNREHGSADRKSFGTQDVIYLLMPDRFSNGDPSNDSRSDLKEKANRSNKDGRHGGDIQGIINHLDYLQNLGITAIWTTPLLEDDQATYSYHTYATTNYYKIDGRYGSNSDYVRLAEECHKRNLKLIMDMVPNHCGSDHWWINDLPMNDWLHQFPEFTRTNYIMATWNDPHASESDRDLNEKGWFDYTMPDLNQDNPIVLTYFKQFAIFWVEYAGLDGIRVDTYPYNNKWKIAEWTKAIRDEYPNLNIVGECYLHSPSEVAYWQSKTGNFDHYDSYLPSVMDFPLNDAMGIAFNEDQQNWDQGLYRLYNVYAMDYLYADPKNIMVFLDNHDMERFSERIGFDISKFKLAVAHLLTTRGIPEIYYGTELMMGGQKSQGDGDIRRDYPGGWSGDARNAFTSEDRSDKEKQAFDFMSMLLNYRKNSIVLHTGKMIQFVPRNNVYVYFRISPEKTIMVVLNNSTDPQPLDISRYAECLKDSKMGKDIISGQRLSLDKLIVNGKTPLILELIP